MPSSCWRAPSVLILTELARALVMVNATLSLWKNRHNTSEAAAPRTMWGGSVVGNCRGVEQCRPHRIGGCRIVPIGIAGANRRHRAPEIEGVFRLESRDKAVGHGEIDESEETSRVPRVASLRLSNKPATVLRSRGAGSLWRRFYSCKVSGYLPDLLLTGQTPKMCGRQALS
jgi:hypothetical protein